MKKFDGILLLSDIDHTFIWKNSYISPKNMEKIKYFTENGGHFAFASGRNHKDIYVAVPALRSLANMPSILCNGSYLYDHETEELLCPRYLDGEKALALLREVRESLPQIGTRITVREGFLVPDDDEVIKRQLTAWRNIEFAKMMPFHEFDGKGYFKAVFSADHESLLQILPIFEKYKDSFDMTSSGDVLFELQPLGVSKSTPIPFLRERYACRTLYAIGDYDNDAEMLRAADVAACPDNASPRIKEIASLHLCHCRDGAVGELIEKIEELL